MAVPRPINIYNHPMAGAAPEDVKPCGIFSARNLERTQLRSHDFRVGARRGLRRRMGGVRGFSGSGLPSITVSLRCVDDFRSRSACAMRSSVSRLFSSRCLALS